MPAAIVYENLADAGTLDASSWIAAAPPATLQNHHVGRRWKGRLGDTEYIVADLGASVSVDSLALLGCQYVAADDTQANMTSAAVTRVRFSTADATGAAGDAYDSGSAAARINAAYGALVKHLAAPVTGRYLRFDLSQSSATALLAGRVVAGLRSPFSINFSYGWGFGYSDLSRKTKSAGGQTFIERDDRFRVLTASFDFMSESNRYGFVLEVDRLNGISRDVMFIIDPESAAPDRDTVWGLLTDMSPPTQPHFEHYAKSYSIEERL